MKRKYIFTILITTALLLLVGMGFSVSFAMPELEQGVPPTPSLSAPNTVHTPSTTHIAKIIANDGAAYDGFGTSLAIDGDIAVAGAAGAAIAGKSNQGAVYIFYRNQGGVNSWGMVKKITASDGAENNGFGASVAIHEDTILVGAPGAGDHDSGAAYIFQRNHGGNDSWGQVKKLVASDSIFGAGFGNAVSLDGDIAVVGAQSTYVNWDPLGTAYIFSRNHGGNNAWGQVKELMASDGQTSDYFGVDVAVSGDTVVVGAYYADGDYTGQGAAYVYEKNWGGAGAWGEIKKLTVGGLYNGFGRSVAISGDTIVVGNNMQEGAAYVFNRNQGGNNAWGYIKTLGPPTMSVENYFGQSVSISEDTIVVGANGTYFLAASNRGAAYVYSRNQGGADTWKLVRMITASDAANDDRFGYPVSVQGNIALIGANIMVNGAVQPGAAYLYETTADVTPPDNPTELTSTSHTTDTWSSQNIVFLTWSGATDPDSGVNGYSILWDQAAITIPDTSKDIEGIYRETYQILTDGSWYCHLRTVDNAGNWTSDAVHLGPFKIDTTAPSPKVYSPEFAVGSFPVIWKGVDSGAGIDYYDIWVREGDYNDWTPWILGTQSTSDFYTGTVGNTYYFASRIVDRVGNANDDDFLFTGLSHTTVAANQITGQVLNNRDEPVFNASVVAQPTALNVGQSDLQGNYALYFGESGAYTLTVSRNGFGQLPPRYGIVVNDNPADVNFVLPPENDIVVNGGLEIGTLSGWHNGIGVTSTLATTAHTGQYSLQLNTSGSDTLIFWPSITQTITLPTDWTAPTLSWVYTINQGDSTSALLLIISGQDTIITRSMNLTPGDWNHEWINLNTLAGQTIELQLGFENQVAGQQVYLDEISLGETGRGVYTAYLPMTLRH